MTRKFAVLILSAALACSGCNKVHLPFGKKAAASTPEPAVASAPAETAGGDPAPPSKPDLDLPAAPSAPAAPMAATTTPKPAVTGAPAKPLVDQSAAVMCLCYHNIEPNAKASKALTISTAQFEQEMEALKTNGFTVIPMQDFLAWRRGEKNIPRKACIITIDDGWSSGYSDAWPVLKQHGYPFTLFIYVNYVGTGGKSLSWPQLEEMRDAGVDIQSHTYSHSNLKVPGGGMDRTHAAMVKKDVATLGVDGWLRKEIVESKQVLEQKLGIRVSALAYPFGVYNQKARELVKEAGYEAAFTVYGQRLTYHAPRDLLGRYAVDAKQPKIFQDALKMIGGGVSPSEADAPNLAQLAASAMVTQPMNNETINTTMPTIKANLSSMGDVENGSVKLRLSGVGPVPVTYNPETKMLTAQITQKLAPGAYSVLVSAKVNGQNAEVRWDFTVAKTATTGIPAVPIAPKGGKDLPAPPSLPKF